jgi:hypothetical protein
MVINTEEEYKQATAQANAIIDDDSIPDPWENPQFIEITNAMMAWEAIHYPEGEFPE